MIDRQVAWMLGKLETMAHLNWGVYVGEVRMAH